ncbi:MAG: DUF1311 domain-containing protein [Verrucomicrobia bacterium]|nr:DUF1311 domain-containing protein [Verrucomicrobiota bacterium]
MTNPVRFLPALALVFSATVSLGIADEEKTDPATAKAHFDRADKALNAAWSTAKAALGESEFAGLKQDQKAWLEYRDSIARSPLHAGVAHEGELPLTSPEYLETAAFMAEERTRWLLGFTRKWGEDENLTGEWSDSCGGSVRIVEQKGVLVFSIECVRGPTSHTGEISGTAKWNQTIGWFSVKADGEDEETSLSFILRDKEFEIIGANTRFFHGARAYFDGKYIKIRSLTQKEKTALLNGEKDDK